MKAMRYQIHECSFNGRIIVLDSLKSKYVPSLKRTAFLFLLLRVLSSDKTHPTLWLRANVARVLFLVNNGLCFKDFRKFPFQIKKTVAAHIRMWCDFLTAKSPR